MNMSAQSKKAAEAPLCVEPDAPVSNPIMEEPMSKAKGLLSRECLGHRGKGTPGTGHGY